MSLKLKEKVSDMKNARNFVSWGVMVFATVASLSVLAQDDLDDLLADLESTTTETPVEQKAEEAVKEVAAEEDAIPETAAEDAPVAAEEVEEEPEEPAPVEETAEEAVAEAAPAVETSSEDEASVVAEKKSFFDELADEIDGKSVAPAVAPAKTAEGIAKAEKNAEAADESAKPMAPAAVAAAAPAKPDAELLENLRQTEKLRREALDVQARREIATARQSMSDAEYGEAVRHYGLALKLLNDRPASKALRKECDQGVAEGLYRAALQEYDLGRRDRAVKFIERAIDMRHPKARRVLERWNTQDESAGERTDLADITHRLNDEDYKKSREQIRRHLRRARQYLAVKDMQHALDECEIVLVEDPYNRDAIRIREAIQKKRKVILAQERIAARDGLIADVDEKWRPVYAVNAAQLKETASETIKKQTGEDPERTQEQDIERRMKEMRLPTISFKPPATIIEAVDFFRTASKDYDRPDIPVEKRGFNFVLKTPTGAIKQQSSDEESFDDFSSNGDTAESSGNGLPPIPTITASDITFYEALKLVCDSVDYKFIVRGPVVMVMQKDMSTAELLSRKYDVLDAFLERMTAASDDVKTMRSQGFGGGNSRKQDDGEENQEKDWKGFFEQMGVKWPEGSSIMYIKTLGKLYVRNTRENLAEFEKVLQEMGSQPKLIEIETRFVEVKQEDLNSLGFEWILNSDYSLNVGDKLGKALGIKKGAFVDTTQTAGKWQYTADAQGNIKWNYVVANNLVDPTVSTSGARWQNVSKQNYELGGGFGGEDPTPLADTLKRNVGINAFGGTDSAYGNGNRYLSDVGNHISGSNASNNDQFMRVNAFLGSADLSMILHMLSQRSDTDLLSAPKVVTKSGENAVIKVVTEYIYPQDYDVQLQSSSSSSSSSSGSSQSAILAIVEPQNFTMREVGVILDVTPTYSEANGGTIDLELKPQVVDEPIWHNYGMKIPFTGNASNSSAVPDFGKIIDSMVSAVTTLGATLSPDDKSVIANRVVDTSMGAINNLSNSGKDNMTWYDAPMEQPFFPVRSIDSKVSITPGSTVVMGGLITEQRKAMDDKVPFLGDLPFIGRLFRSHAEQTVKKNLLIFVTGRLITPSGRELTVNEETAESEAEVKAAPKAE